MVTGVYTLNSPNLITGFKVFEHKIMFLLFIVWVKVFCPRRPLYKTPTRESAGPLLG